ncbi:MAG: ankyrin repeat domain-containing protein [Candidatus Sumerlaeota bacterium]
MRYNHTDCIRLLLARGADVNPRDNANVTPYGIAIMMNHEDTARMLDDAGGME